MYKGATVAFIPWERVSDVSVEGTDQVERRPSVGAVMAFGVLGLGASKTIRRAYLVVATETGDYFFEKQGVLPAGLAVMLGPVLRRFSSRASTDGSEVGALLAETNRLLAEILEELRSR